MVDRPERVTIVRRALVFFAGTAMVLAVGACASDADRSGAAEAADHADLESAAQEVEEPAVIESLAATPRNESEPGRTGLAILDETIPAESIHGDYWPSYEDLRSITCASDIAFIGRITGYTENLLTIPPLLDGLRRTRDVYDGLVFTVDEWLFGDPGRGTEQVTVAFHALFINDYGESPSRVVGGPFGVIRPGIVRRSDADRPRYLVYAGAAGEDSPFNLDGVFYFKTNGGVIQVRADGRLAAGQYRPFWPDHGFDLHDAQLAASAAERLCVRPPLPSRIRGAWTSRTGLVLNLYESDWADRLDRVCKTALGADIDAPVWDQEVALALADEFVTADGLRPDLAADVWESFRQNAARALWSMVVFGSEEGGPSVCWDSVPATFIQAGPPPDGPSSFPAGLEPYMTADAQAQPAAAAELARRPELESYMTEEALSRFRSEREARLWRVFAPLPPDTRELWQDAMGLRAAVSENLWDARLNQVCDAYSLDPVWDPATVAAHAEEFIVEDGGEPTPDSVAAAVDVLWRMAAVPPNGACPWHFPAGTLEPEFLAHMKEIRRAALG